MKCIGIVVPVFPVASETFVVTEINALVALGHKVVVFAFHKGRAPQLKVAANVSVVYLSESPDVHLRTLLRTPLKDTLHGIAASLSQSSSPTFSLLRYSLRLGQLAREWGCTHLHSHFLTSSLAHAVVAGTFFSIPVSTVGHGHDVYQNPTDLKAKLKRCSFAIAVCDDMKCRLQQYTDTHLYKLHCGVNLDEFAFSPSPNNKTTRLLFIGRLVEKKGLDYAIDAFAKLAQTDRPLLHIVGDGSESDHLREQVTQKGLNQWIKFLGYQSPKWLQQNAGFYDGLLAPFCEASNGDRDTGPVVLKEAMAMGLPVITTDFMGCREIVTKETGMLVPPKDANALCTAIQTFCELDKTKRLIMRGKARIRTELEFNAYKQAQTLSTLIQSGESNVCG